ncbi:hypothetical protein N7474_002669 [Penicillium riverlandense]|uniref:uncharacterized protein n=1 Tax=Penicillium riverlandense TaxID=1903569 RepID=UPI0025466FA4|nr:uncharacterized protein N7474_002669 [Penicillium riverlandense]KAJ5825531.1 hypothetical protein N7474_002669 [Penicillium riverlandense]
MDSDTSRLITDIGSELLSQIKAAKDRSIEAECRILQSYSETHGVGSCRGARYLPQYCLGVAFTPAHLSLPQQDKLNNHQYDSTEALEEDLDLMVENAQSYNEDSSQIFADAVRIRKMVTDLLPKLVKQHGGLPAGARASEYAKDKGSSQEASEGDEEEEEEDEEGDEEGDEEEEQDEETEESFEGDTLQQAQDKIMTELARLRDDDGDEVSYPFIGKPDRNLYRDYYEIIQHPVSLRSIQKKVRGTDIRNNPTKVTAYPTWQAFEEEVSYIWRNAREYNEDGSDISKLAGILEEYFRRRVAEAKKLVPDPPQVDGDPDPPRIKLKMGSMTPNPMGQKLTLKMSAQNSDPSSRDDARRAGVTVDNEALKRQQDLVRAGSVSQEIDAHRMSPRTRLRRGLASPGSSTPSAVEQSQAVPMGIKDDVSSPHEMSQPYLNVPMGYARHSLPGPGGLPYHESAFVPAISTPYIVTSLLTMRLDQTPYQQSPGMDSHLRRPGQGSSALIQNIQILTHPTLSLPQDFCLDIPPSATVAQQSITINLPSSHNLLTVRPTLASSTPLRQIKLATLMGMQRLNPTSGEATTLNYDIQLPPGMSKVDVEAIAGPARGVPKTGGSEVDYERVSIFFNVLR